MAKSRGQHGVLLDLDGTLVDSVYHHVRIWHDVLREHEHVVPHWKIHRGIGLDSSRLLLWLLGSPPGNEEAMSKEHERRFEAAAPMLRPTHGAIALLDDLERRGIAYHVVTSASGPTRAALFDVLGREPPATDADDTDESKPAPGPILAGAKALGIEVGQLTMVGDSTWDGEAATRCNARFIAVRCGGFSDETLTRAGALWVEDAPRDLVGRL